MKTGRVVIITGAAGGIGALIAKRFLANGDTVVATDATDGALAKLASSVAKGSKLHTLSRRYFRPGQLHQASGFRPREGWTGQRSC